MKKLLYGLLSLLVTGCSINPANLPRENPQKITNTLESPAHGPFYMEEQTPATAFFDSFPDKIQGIRAIRKYRTPGARRCLVHVLDNHFFWKKDYWDIKNLENAEEEKLHFKILREKYDLVNAVQRDIFNALIDLKKKGLIKNARSEGFTGSYTRDELREFYNHRLDAVLRIGCYDDEISNGNSESFRYIPTAPLILAAAGLLEILPGAKDTKPLGQTEEYWAFDGREDFTLDLIDKAEEPYSVLIFGSLHAFGGKQSCGKDYNEADRTSYKDNILGRKFSLIELFPEHVSLK